MTTHNTTTSRSRTGTTTTLHRRTPSVIHRANMAEITPNLRLSEPVNRINPAVINAAKRQKLMLKALKFVKANSQRIDHMQGELLLKKKQQSWQQRLTEQESPTTKKKHQRVAALCAQAKADLDLLRKSHAKKMTRQKALLKQVLTASMPWPKYSEDKLSRRRYKQQQPLTFIVDLAVEYNIKQACKIISDRLKIKLSYKVQSLPYIAPLLLRVKKQSCFVLTLAVPKQHFLSQRFIIANALKKRIKCLSVQPSESLAPQSLLDQMTDLPPADTDWALRSMGVFNAWQQPLQNGGLALGEGCIIGHLDTGWYPHPEYDQTQILFEQAYNAQTGLIGQDATMHEIRSDMFETETHGLATAAIMVSAPAEPGTTRVTEIPAGLSEPAGVNLQLSGVAPNAKILPVRCFDSVITTIASEGLVRGAEYLIEPDDADSPGKCHIISMSLGGFAHYKLREVLNAGVEKNIVAIAAAGQVFTSIGGPVLQPGSYPNVIGVAASNVRGEATYWSFSGDEIDFSAPGDDIWMADVRALQDDAGNTTVEPMIAYSKGTSYSCAYTAGICALWRAFFQTQLQQDLYSDIPVSHIFRQHVINTVQTPINWDNQRHGSGIINAERLLATPLPLPETIITEHDDSRFNPVTGLSSFFELSETLAAELAAGGQDMMFEAGVLLSEFAQSAQDAASVILLTSAQAMADAAEDISQSSQELLQDVYGLINDTNEVIQEQAQTISEDLEDITEQAFDAAEQAKEEVEDAIEEGVDSAMEMAENVAEQSSETADAIFDEMSSWFGA
ncbi:S8 family serine peptidase [Motilimonas pumila]|uniref:Peptidase S8/S53 domain-containing protein n=1 Tax=Motilimonas pumila TaxID=2303987 RepID=A0A418YD87_9GAMM|nr:S8 family serine peptidase [Motilimonas pumila]RJG42476.1 hypothetical protein D1Z90_13470 [Motilimonas pumila]